ncbi:DNA-directed RNA polymerase subunit [Striga asiatica]|uniref:DNA-directed RNA polymerase subunit n=1 Tax=Striga asiatica TaxID=4170 RepID=A0A5A7P474_STRAF|nr:DNA-directed RNA polymerase subunit [Striga asiatica]
MPAAIAIIRLQIMPFAISQEVQFVFSNSQTAKLLTASRSTAASLMAISIDHRSEVADNNCVYRNEIHHSVGERTQVLQDVAADPTLPRTKSVQCANCGHGEAVFFQATARGEEGMTLFFVCCNPNCGHRWRD